MMILVYHVIKKRLLLLWIESKWQLEVGKMWEEAGFLSGSKKEKQKNIVANVT